METFLLALVGKLISTLLSYFSLSFLLPFYEYTSSLPNNKRGMISRLQRYKNIYICEKPKDFVPILHRENIFKKITLKKI